MKLYKYLKREYADQLINEGTIKIGTYFEFRKMEEDKQRGDKDEGKIIYSKIVERDTEVRDLPSIFTENVKIEGGGKLILKGGAKASAHGEISDCYLFCCSKLYDQKLMTEFEADACIEIFDG